MEPPIKRTIIATTERKKIITIEVSKNEKEKISTQCQPLVDKLKSKYLPKDSDKGDCYLIDIYIRWYRDTIFFCNKYKSESPNRILDEFENKLIKLKMTDKTHFDIFYMRYTGEWWNVFKNKTLAESLNLIENESIFHSMM